MTPSMATSSKSTATQNFRGGPFFKCLSAAIELVPLFPQPLLARGNHLLVFFQLFRGEKRADLCLCLLDDRLRLRMELLAQRLDLFLGIMDNSPYLLLL